MRIQRRNPGSVLLVATGKEALFNYYTDLLAKSESNFWVMGAVYQKRSQFPQHLKSIDTETFHLTPDILLMPEWNEEMLEVTHMISTHRRVPKLLLIGTPQYAPDDISDALPIDFPPPIRYNGLPGFFQHSELLEFAAPMDTPPAALQYIADFFASLGKKTVQVRDRVGLVVPRTLAMIVNEAAFCLMEGVASPEDIDNAMMLATNYPKGPLRWADEVGIDVVASILRNMHQEYMQERYRICPLLSDYITAGFTGVLAGRGFYTY